VLTGAYVKAFLPSDLNGKIYTPEQNYQVPIDPDDLPHRLTHTVRWARMDHDQRTKAALAAGEALHPGFTGHVFSDAGLSICWDNQPYQFGINAGDNFAARPQTYARLIEPLDRHDRLYLAGDSLSFWNGWQEGAVRSAWWTLQKIFNHTEAQAQ
jgi:monoamine oxidase